MATTTGFFTVTDLPPYEGASTTTLGTPKLRHRQTAWDRVSAPPVLVAWWFAQIFGPRDLSRRQPPLPS